MYVMGGVWFRCVYCHVKQQVDSLLKAFTPVLK